MVIVCRTTADISLPKVGENDVLRNVRDAGNGDDPI
jgi:hypothetical protein